MDTYPVFYDIVEILMSSGLIYTSDYLKTPEGRVDTLPVDKRMVSMMEKYVDFFTLLTS